MIEKISQVNEALESLIEKLKNNYERLEKKAIEAGKGLDEESSSGEYEALALIKKEAIINKVLYQYYSQKLRSVMEKAETSIGDMITLNGKNDVFEVEVNSRDYMNNIDLDELCKGVRSFAVTDELLSTFEIFSGSSVAPKEEMSPSTKKSKIKYEEDKTKYDINSTDDEQVLIMAGSSAQPMTEELKNAGSNTKTLSKKEKEAGSNAEPLSEGILSAGSNAQPISEELKNAGSNARTLSKKEREAGSNAGPLPDGLLSAGSNVKALSEEEMAAGSSAETLPEEIKNAGSSVKTLTKEDLIAGSDAEPLPEGLLTAGSDFDPTANEDN